MFRSHWSRFSAGSVFLVAIVFLVATVACGDNSERVAPGPADESPAETEVSENFVVNSQGYKYVAPDPSAYAPSSTIQHWVDNFDDASIESHAWDLWVAINAPSGQFHQHGDVKVEVAVWETWFDEFETFRMDRACSTPGCNAALPLHGPRQQTHGAEVLSFNKYSLEFLTWINEHKLWDETTLIELNEKYENEGTPLDQRFLPFQDLDAKATMLKPSFWVIKPDRPAPMQYWLGPGVTISGTLDPDVPTPSTWTQIVVVDPTGTAKPGTPYTLEVRSSTGVEKMTFTDYEIVGLDRFYWVPLTQADVDFVKAGNVFIINGVPTEELEAGDLALLVAQHLTTAEFGNWTWQSFWWSPNPSHKAPPRVPAPFDNYELTLSYYMLGPDGAPHISMNPFLEPPDEGSIFMDPTQLGVKSNCMTCHHVAAFPTLNRESSLATMLLGSYVATGQISGTEQYFSNRVKTRFMWGMVDFNQQQGKLND